MRGMRWLGLAMALAGCDGPDEWTCELEVNGVPVCVDLKSRKYCEAEWGGTATASEKLPGGPYEYCDDLYAVSCSGSLTEQGDNFTASHAFYAASEEDCATADGGTVGG